MSQPEARAWWADVQQVRESIERRRAAADRRDGGRRRAEHYAPRWDELDELDDGFEPRRRFARDVQPRWTPTPAQAATAASQRRTVEITGHPVGAPSVRQPPTARRRPARRPSDRVGHRPDRVALWAVALAIFLILVAATSSSQAATPAAPDASAALVAPAR